MTNETDKAKDTKATRVPGTLDNATGKRKKKKLVGLAQTGPRRLVPKKMVAKVRLMEMITWTYLIYTRIWPARICKAHPESLNVAKRQLARDPTADPWWRKLPSSVT